MKKKLSLIALVATCVVYYTHYQNTPQELSSMQLANVEALSASTPVVPINCVKAMTKYCSVKTKDANGEIRTYLIPNSISVKSDD